MFPDWFANNTQAFWTDALRNWSQLGVNYSGIWLDMNEASSFCVGSWYVPCQCLHSRLMMPDLQWDWCQPHCCNHPDAILPGDAGQSGHRISGGVRHLIIRYVITSLNTRIARYNATIWGPSGNITINGTLTFGTNDPDLSSHAKRGLGAAGEPGTDLNTPPYAIHNGTL